MKYLKSLGPLFLFAFFPAAAVLAQPQVWSMTDSPTGLRLSSVWGNSVNDAFAVGQSGTIARFNGSGFTDTASPTGNTLNDIWGSGGTYYAVGELGTILRFDGNTWLNVASPTGNSLLGIWGNSNSDILAVGTRGTILRFNGNQWQTLASPTGNNLRDVWSPGSTSAFAVGEQGTILILSGGIWSSMASPTGNTINAVWGSSASDVYAVGTGGLILRFNGTGWSQLTPAVTGQTLNDVFGTGPNDVFAVGTQGTILHFDGLNWTQVQSGTGNDLYGVWTGTSGSLERGLAVGSSGTVTRGDSSRAVVGTATPITPGPGQETPASAFITDPTATATAIAGSPTAVTTATPTVLVTAPQGFPTAVPTAPLQPTIPFSPVLPTIPLNPFAPVLPTQALLGLSPVLPTGVIVPFSPTLTPTFIGFVLDLTGRGVGSVLVTSRGLASSATSSKGLYMMSGPADSAGRLSFKREDFEFRPSSLQPRSGEIQAVLAFEKPEYRKCTRHDVSGIHVLIDRQAIAIRDAALGVLNRKETMREKALSAVFRHTQTSSLRLPVLIFTCPKTSGCRTVSTSPAVGAYQRRLRALKRFAQDSLTTLKKGPAASHRAYSKKVNELAKQVRAITNLLNQLPEQTALCGR